MIEPILIGAGLLLLVAFLIVSYLHGRRVRIRSEEALRKRARAAERESEAEDKRQEEYLAVRRLARERARIAYPDLLDADEANGPNRGDAPGRMDVDPELVREAQALLDSDISALKKNPDARYGSPARDKLGQLEYEARILECVHEDAPSYRKPALYLDGGARIIDCGEAGRVELYSAAQVEEARTQSGYSDYVRFLEDRVEAPELAKRIIDRAREKADELERERLQAQAAITTKLDDLPPLEAKRREGH